MNIMQFNVRLAEVYKLLHPRLSADKYNWVLEDGAGMVCPLAWNTGLGKCDAESLMS